MGTSKSKIRLALGERAGASHRVFLCFGSLGMWVCINRGSLCVWGLFCLASGRAFHCVFLCFGSLGEWARIALCVSL